MQTELSIIRKIKLPNKDFFENKLKEVKKIKDDLDKEWERADSEEICFEEIAFMAQEKESIIINNYLSSGLLIPFIGEVEPLPEGMLYDVRKIAISEGTDSFLQDYNVKVLSIFFSETKSDLRIRKDLAWYNLSIGFRTEREIEDNCFYLLEDFLIKSENK